MVKLTNGLIFNHSFDYMDNPTTEFRYIRRKPIMKEYVLNKLKELLDANKDGKLDIEDLLLLGLTLVALCNSKKEANPNEDK